MYSCRSNASGLDANWTAPEMLSFYLLLTGFIMHLEDGDTCHALPSRWRYFLTLAIHTSHYNVPASLNIILIVD